MTLLREKRQWAPVYLCLYPSSVCLAGVAQFFNESIAGERVRRAGGTIALRPLHSPACGNPKAITGDRAEGNPNEPENTAGGFTWFIFCNPITKQTNKRTSKALFHREKLRHGGINMY